MIIEFGRWQLRSYDGRNWALATTKNWEKATNKKRPSAPNNVRYFQWNTLSNAFIYAASRDLMDKEGTVDAMEFAREFEAAINANIAAAIKAWDNYTSTTAKTPCATFAPPQTNK